MKEILTAFLVLWAPIAFAGDSVNELGYIFNGAGAVTNVFMKFTNPTFGPLCVEVTASDGIDMSLDKTTGDLKQKTAITNLLLVKYKTMVTDLQAQAASLPAKESAEAAAKAKITLSVTNQDLSNALK